ncbi:HTH-type transcriptional regulator/antitoxin HigA [Celeribacter persicus]|jgi:Predicted transcription regulator containing HTH domain|uniref:HTH-type transcriptional regulator/antitoxin HigA n=2 Tax=Celeribacter persicus TaxID=1651082 RepID=A0A2T5HCI8_9RHOB|nr:HTH-type transcriptional regulator/antitoxin HigA [Celeribacter persicus]
MDNIRPIRTEEDLTWALAEIEPYFVTPPAPGTPDADRFDVLTDLIESYEDRHHSIQAPDPVEALQFYMEETHKNITELGRVLGSRPRASEVMSRKRRLSLDMIRKIHTAWKIPSDTLIQPYHLDV